MRKLLSTFWSCLLGLHVAVTLLVATLSVAVSSSEAATTRSCPGEFSKIGRFYWEKDPLEALKKIIRAQNPEMDHLHSMGLVNGKGHVKIGLLTAEDPEFLQRLTEAVRAGKIQQIDIGAIVGPKVFNWIVRMQEAAPRGHVMTITGRLDVKDVFEAKTEEIMTMVLYQSQGRAGEIERAYKWTDADIARFDAAVEALGLKDACKKFWDTSDFGKCGRLKFSLRSNDINSIAWERN